MEMSWVDQRLSWDPAEFGNITEITLPVSKLWVFYNQFFFFYSHYQNYQLIAFKKNNLDSRHSIAGWL